MARARSLKPGFFRDRKLLDLPPLTRLLFAGLWTIADREGRLADDSKQIRLDVMPSDRYNVEAGLQQLADGGFIIRYESGPARYIQVRTWKKHQNPHVKEPASTIPAPCENCAGAGNSGAKTPDSLNPIPLTLNPEPVTGIPAGNGMLNPSLTESDPGYWAERLYARHPKKKNLSLVQAWFVSKDYPAETLREIDRVHTLWCATEDWTKKSGQYAPKLDEWLADRGWSKEPDCEEDPHGGYEVVGRRPS